MRQFLWGFFQEKGNEEQQQRQKQIRGFFAALRMTIKRAGNGNSKNKGNDAGNGHGKAGTGIFAALRAQMRMGMRM